ncbi:MAG: hypothetical protein HQ488_00055 [Parcubacteria group bacterium]|nr:hypothetical protein [Parcubacteria group bacterium]
MSEIYEPQVGVETYKSKKYNTSSRWWSHALVIKEVLEMNPKTILEVGPGNMIVL